MTDDGGRAKSARTSFSALRPLLPYVGAFRGRIVAAGVALLFASGATLAMPFAIRRVIDFGFADGGADVIRASFLALIAVTAVLALSSGLRFYLVMTLGERVVAELRADLFAHLAHLDPPFFDRERIGELVSRLTADTTQLKSAFGASASIALRNILTFAGATALMATTSPKLSLYVLAAIPVIVLPLYAAGRAVRDRSKRAQDALAGATAYAAESLGAVRVMQAFTAEGATSQRFRAAGFAAFEAARTMTVSRAIVTASAIFLAFSSIVVVLWFGASDVVAGRMSAGSLSQFVLFAVLGASSMGQLSEVWSELSAAAGAAARIAALLDERPRVTAPANPESLPSPPRGEIEFAAVHYAYPSAPDAPALRDVSFRVKPGEVVALVGPSGAGKSTVVQLLLRFFDPTSGIVRFDGCDISHLRPDNLRRAIAYVPQEATIFGASVAENIAYGTPGASLGAIRQAAERAAAHGFISALPQGYDTVLGERGATLSGGERQRVAIARAILKNAPVLLLDEATSALDAQNEALVQRALEESMRDRTTLVVAHRLATVVKAHRILVFDGGGIVEQGTHAELLAAGGLYARLARLQFDTGAEALRPSVAPASA